MAIKLIVIESFAGYGKGDEITDPNMIRQILEGENSGHVVQAAAPEAPAASAEA